MRILTKRLGKVVVVCLLLLSVCCFSACDKNPKDPEVPPQETGITVDLIYTTLQEYGNPALTTITDRIYDGTIRRNTNESVDNSNRLFWINKMEEQGVSTEDFLKEEKLYYKLKYIDEEKNENPTIEDAYLLYVHIGILIWDTEASAINMIENYVYGDKDFEVKRYKNLIIHVDYEIQEEVLQVIDSIK